MLDGIPQFCSVPSNAPMQHGLYNSPDASRCGLQVHKFSKFIHGSAVLLPDMVQAVPYWIDDESIRKSIVQSSSQG